MPTPLLEQTRCVLRSRFSSVIRKRVFTLQFDRSCDDSREEVLALLAKLDAARRQVWVGDGRNRERRRRRNGMGIDWDIAFPSFTKKKRKDKKTGHLG